MKRPLGTVSLFLALLLAIRLGTSAPPGTEIFTAQDGEVIRPEEGEICIVTGRVVGVEERSSQGGGQTWITLRSVMLHRDLAPEAVSSYDILCKMEGEDRPLIGSALRVRGRISYFSQGRNPGEFDAARYYGALGIGACLEKAGILAASREYSRLGEGLYRLRARWKEKLYRRFPEKEASVLTTMLLGDKTGLDPTIKDLYQRNGIVHILSISGLHITLIGLGLYRLLRKAGCPGKAAALLGGVVLVLYGLLTGLGISACRAIGMYLLRMLGEILGRTYDMLTALGTVGLLMLLYRPAFLWHSGFLLSFGSLCGIGLLTPVLSSAPSEKGMPGEKGWGRLGRKAGEKIRAVLAPGLSVSIFTLPIQLWFFYEIPVYAQLLNLFVLPAMGIVMSLGLAVMLLPGGLVGGFLAGLFARADVLILDYYEWLCLRFERLPGHTWTPGAPRLWQVAAYYLLLGIFLFWFGRVQSAAGGKRKFFPRLLFPLAIGIIGLRFQGGTQITFLDVGQGDCICVRTLEGEVYLFDGGSSSRQGVGEYVILPYLKHQGITRIDAVFLSHPDSDHDSGLLELMELGPKEGLVIDRLFLPAIASKRREKDFEEVLRTARESRGTSQGSPLSHSIRVEYLSKGDSWRSKDATFTCFHPEAGTALEDANAYSLCFLMEQGGFSMLLTGDVEGEGEEGLYRTLAEGKVENVTLLKVAHHGSRNSTPEKLLALLSPQIAVISCGKDNSYGHPHRELLDRLDGAGCRVFVTARSGAISLEVNSRELRLKTYLSE